MYATATYAWFHLSLFVSAFLLLHAHSFPASHSNKYRLKFQFTHVNCIHGAGTRSNTTSNGSSKKARDSRKRSISCLTMPFCANNCGKFERDGAIFASGEIPYTARKATARTDMGIDWFQIGTGCGLPAPLVFNLYAEYNMRNVIWESIESRLLITSDM